MVEAQLAQMIEARIALAEIVERDPHACILQRAENFGGHIGVVDNRILGDFDDQPCRREAGLGENRKQPCRQPPVLELQRRDIDRSRLGRQSRA